jgi:hypothetical protein
MDIVSVLRTTRAATCDNFQLDDLNTRTLHECHFNYGKKVGHTCTDEKFELFRSIKRRVGTQQTQPHCFVGQTSV